MGPAQRRIVKALPTFPPGDTCLTCRCLLVHKWQEFINIMASSRETSVFAQGRKTDALLVLLRKTKCPNPLPCCCSLLRYLHQLLIKAELWANQGALKTFLQWIIEQPLPQSRSRQFCTDHPAPARTLSFPHHLLPTALPLSQLPPNTGPAGYKRKEFS